MINIIGSRSIAEWIWKTRRTGLDGDRLVSSTNGPRNFILLRSRTDGLIYFSVYVAIPLLLSANMVLRPTWHFRAIIVLTRSWCRWVRKSRIKCGVINPTSWVWSLSTFKLPTTVAPGRKQRRFAIHPMMRCLVPIKNRILTIGNISTFSSIPNNSTFRSNMSNCVILRCLRSLSASALNWFFGLDFNVSWARLDFLIKQVDVVCCPDGVQGYNCLEILGLPVIL